MNCRLSFAYTFKWVNINRRLIIFIIPLCHHQQGHLHFLLIPAWVSCGLRLRPNIEKERGMVTQAPD
jgi:hypothetical protein